MTAQHHAKYGSNTPSRFREIPSLIYLVKSLEAANRSQMDALLRDASVTTMQYLTLGVLLEHEALSGAALARRTFVKPQSMQDIIQALEAKGYIERKRPQEDRRERVISITDSGAALMRQLESRVAAFDTALCDDFSAAEEAQFRNLLRRAGVNAQAYEI